MKDWLIKCNYPADIIDKGIHNAKLQGPAPKPKDPNDQMIFVSTYHSNYSNKNTVQQINNLIHNTQSERLNTVFNNTKVIIAHKQPPNLLRRLTKAAFNTSIPPSISNATQQQEWGLFKCKRATSNCKICRLYIQECKSFLCSDGTEWFIKSHIDCHSINLLYFLKCLWCPDPSDPETYTGKTVDTRLRMNNHMTGCRYGGSDDQFDNHVFECRQKHGTSGDIEPYFHMYAFYTIKNAEFLGTHEKHLHNKGLDTMNKPR